MNNILVKYSVLLLLLALASFSSCKKEVKEPIIEPTNSFTQKVIVEKFTTTSCGNCGKADLDIEWFKNYYNNKVIPIHYHLYTGLFGGDKMATNDGQDIANAFEVNATPYASINRTHIPSDSNTIIYAGGSWATPIANQIAVNTSCGVALDASKINGKEMIVEATVGFNKTISTPLYITVLLLEDSVTGDTGYWQANYYDQDPNVPELYGRGHPIKNYIHNDVYRQAISSFWGDRLPIEYTTKGNTQT